MCPALKFMGTSGRRFAILSAERLERRLTISEALRILFRGLLSRVCRPLRNQLENLRRLTFCCGQLAPVNSPAGVELTPEAREIVREVFVRESADADA